MLALVSSCAQWEYSQFQSEDETVLQFKIMYNEALVSCDGLEAPAHKKCAMNIRLELARRYADMKEALMTAEQIMTLVASYIVL